MTATTLRHNPIVVTAAFIAAITFIAEIGRKERERRMSLATAHTSARSSVNMPAKRRSATSVARNQLNGAKAS